MARNCDNNDIGVQLGGANYARVLKHAIPAWRLVKLGSNHAKKPRMIEQTIMIPKLGEEDEQRESRKAIAVVE